VFLTGLVVAVTQFSRWIPVMAAAQIAAAAAIAVYMVIAQHRVYGGSWPASLVKALGVGVLYVALWGITSIAATLWASRV